MMKIVLKLDFHENKCRTKAFKKASGLSGVEAVALDSNDQKLTLTGDIDPVLAVSKLRKVCHTDIVSVGPAKEPEKKKDPPKKDPPKPDPPQLICYPPPMCTYGYHPMSDCYYGCTVVEEHTSTCVIC